MATPRVVGLSKKQQPKPLHTNIGGRDRSQGRVAAERMPPSQEDGRNIRSKAPQARAKPKKEEPAVDAPPMSSSDESSEPDSVKEGHRASRESKSTRSSAEFSARSRHVEGRKESARASQVKRPPGKTATRFESDEDDASSDGRSRQADMAKTNFGSTKSARTETGSAGSRATRILGSGKRHQPALADDDEKFASNRPRNKDGNSDLPEDFLRGERKRSRGATYLSKERLSQQEEPRPAAKRNQRLKPKPSKDFIKPKKLSLTDEPESPVSKKPRRSGASELFPSRHSSPSPERAFVMPTRLLDLGSPPSSASNLGLKDEASPGSRIRGSSARSLSPISDLDSLLGDSPMCPMCHKPVAQDLLDEYKQKHPRMSIAQQRKFCDLHIEVSAQKTWIEKGYPDINWSGMEKRISKHRDFLRNILHGAQSHYTNVFNHKVQVGMDKTTVKSEKSLTPGYYGPRGLRVMTDSIMEQFTQLLLERSREDRLIAARGRVAYVQSVLVPEVAVKLIMEDMNVDEEAARAIFTDSASLGDVLNEEAEDIDRYGANASEADSV